MQNFGISSTIAPKPILEKQEQQPVIKLGQKSAFGFGYIDRVYDRTYSFSDIPKKEEGMSKRFYAACCAMKAIISKDTHFNNNVGLPDIKTTISEAYAYADELLKQEND